MESKEDLLTGPYSPLTLPHSLLATRYSLFATLRLSPPQALDPGSVFLRGQTPFLRSAGRPGGPARRRRHAGALDQLDEAVERILSVALLGAVTLRHDDQNAVAGEPAARQPFQPHAHVGGQRGRAAHVEAQLHGARELVDVLAARPGSAHEALLQLAFLDADAVGYPDHGEIR